MGPGPLQAWAHVRYVYAYVYLYDMYTGIHYVYYLQKKKMHCLHYSNTRFVLLCYLGQIIDLTPQWNKKLLFCRILHGNNLPTCLEMFKKSEHYFYGYMDINI